MATQRHEAAPGRPPSELEVPATQLTGGGSGGGRGGSSKAPILVALGIFGAVLAAIALGQAFPVVPDGPVGPRAPTAAASDASRAPSPRGAASGPNATANAPAAIVLPPRLRASALVEGVLDGSLDGYLVYADATLEDGCEASRLPSCAGDLSVRGLALEVRPVFPPDGENGWAGDVADQAVLVLAVNGQRLDYLGSLIAARDGSPALERVTAQALALRSRAPVQSLYDTSGWLVINPACVTPGGAAASCPERPPFLADDPPLADGVLRSDRGQAVALSPALWGVDPATDTVSTGPFLVRRADAGAGRTWEVVARYDPSRSVRVVIP